MKNKSTQFRKNALWYLNNDGLKEVSLPLGDPHVKLKGDGLQRAQEEQQQRVEDALPEPLGPRYRRRRCHRWRRCCHR